MFENPFTPLPTSYKRQITPIKDYIEQASFYLSKKLDIPLEEAEQYVKKMSLGKGHSQVKIPTIHYLERGENGDRERRSTSLVEYLKDSIRNKEIIAPTLTTYIPTGQYECINSNFIDGNIQKRSRAKKAMFAAEAKGDMFLMSYEDGNQRNSKLSNNALSGAYASKSNPLFNPTGHSTLTSNCRMTSAFGNANNEKLLSGNRHYHSPDIVLNNINAIITHSNHDQWLSVMDKYKLYYPNTEDVMDCIRYSTDLYWSDHSALTYIESYVDKLIPLEKAMFVYTGDIYHLKKHNEAFVRSFLEDLASKHTQSVKSEDLLATLKTYPEDIVALGHQICSKELQGKGKDHAALKGTDELQTLVSTVVNIGRVLTDYQDLIKTLWVSDNVPASVSHFPSSIRRAALTSDTDSTIFTVQEWVLWLNNGQWWGEKAIAYAASMIFLASQAIIHILARMSINNGIDPKYIYKIAMKNEFYFPVYVTTSVNKHYFASISCQEGNVYKDVKREVKGVHLKNSNTPKFINDYANEIMNRIMDTVMRGEKIVLKDYLKEIAQFERDVIQGILKGESKYFRAGMIKQPNSYNSEPERSPYFHYMLWKEVFAPTYGDYGEPPYDIINVGTTLINRTATEEWIKDVTQSNPELGERLQAFLIKHGKTTLGNIQVPVTAIASTGMPLEIQKVINARSIAINMCKIFYLILNSLGYTVLNDNRTTLLSDMY